MTVAVDYRAAIEERRKSLHAYCLQDWAELAELAGHVDALKPEIVCEIGTGEGGWLWLMQPFFAPGSTLIGIDPLTKAIMREERFNDVANRLAGAGHVAHFLKATSAVAINAVHGILGGRLIDLLHIDGAHDYDTVRFDWETFGPLVRPGGLVAFHDIHSRAAAEKVWRLWDEIKADGWRTIEIGTLPRVGIGIVRM